VGRSRRYLTVMAGGLALAGLSLSAVNLTVDPYAVFPSIHRKDLDPFRRNESRTAKASRLAAGGWDGLILGSSRAVVAFDPGSPHWGERVVFNGGLKGTNLFEVRRVYDHARRHNRLRRVLLTVDLHAMGAERGTSADFDDSLFRTDLDPVDYRLRHLLGWSPTKEARDVWRESRAGGEPGSRVEIDGFRRFAGGIPRTFDRFVRVLRRDFFVNPETFRDFTYDPTRLDEVRAVLRGCREDGTAVTVLVPPVHPLMLEGIRLMGLEGAFERMKRDLVAAAAEDGPEGTEVFDATGYGGDLAEPVPLEGEAEFRWFLDASHANAAFGERVLARVLGKAAADPAVPVARLDAGNLEAHFAAFREEGAAWRAAHFDLVARLEAVHREAVAGRASGGTGETDEGE